MDTQRTKKVGYSKASIALVAALSCLLIYILACVLSPPTWSPDCSKIAILVTPPGDDPDMFAVFTYDIATGQRVLLDQVKADGVLSAPAWSPDGKWIAYYKVEPSPPEEPESSAQDDPNAKVPNTGPTEEVTNAENKAQEMCKEIISGEELFSEENKMLPPFIWEVIKDNWHKENKDQEMFDVKLVVIKPDGTDRKVLQVMKCAGDEDARAGLLISWPQWSKDCKHLFYFRLISDDLCYIGSLNMDTGQTEAHSFSSIASPSVSQDGRWSATLLQLENGSEEFLLNLVAIDGSAQKYFKIDMEMDFEFVTLPLTWSLDLKKVWITTKDKFLAVDADTGSIRQYVDPSAVEIGFGMFSPSDNRLYYLATYETDDPNVAEEKIQFMCMNVADGKIQKLFEISDLPDSEDQAMFYISPNGKMILLRCVMEHETGKDKSALIFWDGTTRKIVETDRWLMKPLYSEEDLIFEKKLIGKWKDEDGETLVSEGTQEKTYKITFTEKDGDKYHCAAHLVKLKGMMFMGIFLDESVLQKKDSYGSHLLPDGFMKIDQIEPKLLLREEMDYDDFAEMLKMDPELLKQEASKVGYAIEAIRVQPKDSNAPAERN